MALVPFPQKSASSAPDDDPDWEDEESESEQGKMSFLDHLDELRRRIIISLVAVLIGCGIALVFVGPIFQFVFQPMQALLPAGQTLIYTDPSEAFFLQIKLALMAGLILASPVVASQVWLFIAPGLYAHEKKLAIPFIVMSSAFGSKASAPVTGRLSMPNSSIGSGKAAARSASSCAALIAAFCASSRGAWATARWTAPGSVSSSARLGDANAKPSSRPVAPAHGRGNGRSKRGMRPPSSNSGTHARRKTPARPLRITFCFRSRWTSSFGST